MFEKMIKRTIWIAQCPNDFFRKEWTNNPPREVQCPKCKTWIKSKETSFTGPDFEEAQYSKRS